MAEIILTDEQNAILDAARRNSPRNIAINAAAGTGKSYSSKRIISDSIPESQSAQYCAFNRHTADEFLESVKELTRGTNRRVFSKTFNGMGFSAMLRRFNIKADQIELDDGKYLKLCKAWATKQWPEGEIDPKTGFPFRDEEEVAEAAKMLDRLIKMMMCNTTYPRSGSRELVFFCGNFEDGRPRYVPFDLHDEVTLRYYAGKYDLGGLEHPEDEDDVIKAVPLIVDQAEQMMNDPYNRTVSFMEQVFWCVVKDWPVYQSYWIIVDECQDLSGLDRALVDKHIFSKSGQNPIGRIAIVGDPQQAIYMFRGADSHGFQNSKHFWRIETEYLLSQSYRCPKVISALCSAHKPGYRSHENAPEGQIKKIDFDAMFKVIDPDGDHAIISRTRAELIPTWRKLVAMGKPAVIIGRDNASGINAIIKQVAKKKSFRFSNLRDDLDKYAERRVKAMVKRGKSEAEIENFRDQMQAVYGAIDAVPNVHNVEDLCKGIEAIFKNPEGTARNVIKIMTGHGSKGLEFKEVFCITPKKFPLDFPSMTDEQYEQEKNLQYVMRTRTKLNLFLVYDKDDEELKEPVIQPSTVQPTLEPYKVVFGEALRGHASKRTLDVL